MTSYARAAEDGGITGGSAIIPLSERQAKNWSKEHLSAEEYLKLFDTTE